MYTICNYRSNYITEYDSSNTLRSWPVKLLQLETTISTWFSLQSISKTIFPYFRALAPPTAPPTFERKKASFYCLLRLLKKNLAARGVCQSMNVFALARSLHSTQWKWFIFANFCFFVPMSIRNSKSFFPKWIGILIFRFKKTFIYPTLLIKLLWSSVDFFPYWPGIWNWIELINSFLCVWKFWSPCSHLFRLFKSFKE